MQTEETLKTEVPPTEKTVGQHQYFISKGTSIDELLLEAAERGLKVLGWKRIHNFENPEKKYGVRTYHVTLNSTFLVKCMAK